MDWDWKSLRQPWAVVFLIGCAIAGAFAGHLVGHGLLRDGVLAAWVQAAGVIAAIIFSIQAAGRQERFNRLTEVQRSIRRRDHFVRDVRVLVFNTENFLNELPAYVRKGAHGQITDDDVMPERATVLAALAAGVDTLRLPDFNMITAIADLRAKISRIAHLLTRNHDPAAGSHNPWQEDREAAGRIAADALDDCADFQREAEDFFNRGGPAEDEDV